MDDKNHKKRKKFEQNKDSRTNVKREFVPSGVSMKFRCYAKTIVYL